MPDVALARAIAAGMERVGLDVRGLASRLGESPHLIEGWLASPKAMSVESVADVAAVFGVLPSSLFSAA